MSTYTVKQIAKLAGISVRTLHHYHQIGLLVPRMTGANGYRYYGESELLRLQQILLYRSIGLKLAKIGQILDTPEFDTLAALQNHRARLLEETKRLPVLIKTIDRTIETIKGSRKMNANELYKGLSPEKQAEYEAELSAKGPDMATKVKHASAHNKGKSKAQVADDMAELERVESALVANMRAGLTPTTPENAPLVKQHRAWVASMWGRACSPEAHIGLAQMYESHPDFKQRYESLAEGFTAYLCSTIRAHSH